MPARVVLVHDDPAFLLDGTLALRAAFLDSMAALDAIENARTADLLITRVQFPPGTPHGVSLAHIAQRKHPGLKVLFVSLPEYVEHTEDLGACLTWPVQVPDLVEAVRHSLGLTGEKLDCCLSRSG